MTSQALAIESAQSTEVVGARRPRIHSIDDDADISRVIKMRLEQYGVDVIRSFSGMQGFWTSLDMKPDVIITDLVMPDGDGNYIFSRLQEHPLTREVPVIVLTGQHNSGLRRQLLGMGAAAYLTKPIDFKLLLDTLRKYIPLLQAV